MRTIRLISGVVLASLLVSGCSSGNQELALRPAPGQDGQPRVGSTASSPALAFTGAQQSRERHRHGEQQALGPAELRVELEKLLGQHVFATVRFTRARINGQPDFADAAVAALNRNTEDLAEIVGRVYGREGAEAFSDLWFSHTRSFFNYTDAVVDGDKTAQRAARRALDDYRQQFGEFVSTATDGEIPAQAVAANLRPHVGHLLDQVDAYAKGNYERAYALQREAYAHMFPTGKALAGGFSGDLPGEFPVPVDGGQQQLRSALGLLLGEHIELAVDATRAGVTGAPDFEQAAATLNANTRELTAAMEAVFGRRGARRFNTLWSDHIDLVVDYTVALAEGDRRAKRAARRGLRRYQNDFASFLSEATGRELRAKDVARHMERHDDQLVAQLEAYAAQNYPRAHRIAFRAYQQMFDVAAQLASALAADVGRRLPRGGAATGGGGTAGAHH